MWGGGGREGFFCSIYIYNYNEMKISNTGIINLDFLYVIILNVNSLFKNNEYLRVYISYKLVTLQSQSMNCGQIICKIYNWFSWGLIVKEAPDNILYHLSFKKNKTPLC